MKKKKVLVTGGNGFVGKQVIKEFNHLDFELTLILRSDNKNIISNNKAIKFIIISKNIFKESVSWWKNTFADIDIVIHLAWYVEPGKYLDSSINELCYKGTVNMAKGATLAGVDRFIGIGTCFEYKFSNSPLEVTSPLDPKTIYANSKVKTFNYLTDYFFQNKIEFLWCRLFYLFGEDEDERRLVPYLRKNLSEGKMVNLTSGEKLKDYLNIKDAGKIIAHLSINKHTGPYNVCSGKGVTIKALCEQIADEYNRRDLLKFGRHEGELYDPPYIVGKKTDPNF